MVRYLKKGLFFIVIGAVIIVFLIVTKDDDLGESSTEFSSVEATEDIEEQDQIDEQAAVVIVDVKGEVKNPGVYEMDRDTRVNDVIQLAGGFSNKADETFVNLAQRVQDEMIILVPKVGEVGEHTGAGSTQSSKVKVNYATQEEMESLTGIGPAKAQAIIQYRDEEGLFQTVEELLEVSGIGEKTLETIRDDLQIP